MRDFKYVVTQVEGCPEQIFVFPKTIDHDQFAEVLSHLKEGPDRNWTRPYRKPISAGFTDGVNCYGKSESLGIGSRLTDSDLLK